MSSNNSLIDKLCYSYNSSYAIDDVIENFNDMTLYKEKKIYSKFPFYESIPGFKEAVIDKKIDNIKEYSLCELLEMKKNENIMDYFKYMQEKEIIIKNNNINE